MPRIRKGGGEAGTEFALGLFLMAEPGHFSPSPKEQTVFGGAGEPIGETL